MVVRPTRAATVCPNPAADSASNEKFNLGFLWARLLLNCLNAQTQCRPDILCGQMPATLGGHGCSHVISRLRRKRDIDVQPLLIVQSRRLAWKFVVKAEAVKLPDAGISLKQSQENERQKKLAY